MKHLLLIFLCFISFCSFAQEKCFNAYDQQDQEVEVLCVGQEYSFQDCGNQVPDDNEYYVFEYKSGTAITNPSNDQKHTFSTPGKHRVLQIANYGSNTLTDTVSVVFEVLDSPAPTFETQSCASGAVSVTITDENYDRFSIDFGDGQQVTYAMPYAPVQHNYSTPGTYQITVTGAYEEASCQGEGAAPVEVLPAATVSLIRNLTVLEQAQTGTIQMDLEDLQPGYSYVIQQWQVDNPRLNFQSIDTIRNITQTTLTYSLQNVNTTQGNWYLVRPLDECGTTFLNSNIVSSIAVEAASANEQVTLSWQAMPHADSFEIYRNGSLIQTIDASIMTFTDAEVSCGQPYLYKVRGVATNGSSSMAAAIEVEVVSSVVPPAPYLISSYNLNNQVEVRLELQKGEIIQQINIERSASGGAFQALAQVGQAQYTDAVSGPASYCYRATFTNACGNTSPVSNTSCPILLQAQKQNTDAVVSLEWTNYEGFLGGVRQYTVELLDENGNVVSSYPANGNTYTDRTLSTSLAQLRYRIRGTSADGTDTYSNTAVVEQELLLYVPSGFTPNGDGLNDIFEVKGRFFNRYSIRVYNSLGNVVYEGTEADAGWDGTYKGRLQPAGAYAYEITAETTFGSTKRRTGTVTLLR